MFYMPNVTCSGMAAKRVSMEDGDDALAIGENLKEIVDFDGYRSALNTLREATHSVRPWDRSIGALVGFMTNTNYLQEDLRASQRRAAILSEFTDHVLARNALNYANDQGFLTTEELAHTWTQWKGKRMAFFQFKKEERPWSKGKKSDICRSSTWESARSRTRRNARVTSEPRSGTCATSLLALAASVRRTILARIISNDNVLS